MARCVARYALVLLIDLLRPATAMGKIPLHAKAIMGRKVPGLTETTLDS